MEINLQEHQRSELEIIYLIKQTSAITFISATVMTASLTFNKGQTQQIIWF